MKEFKQQAISGGSELERTFVSITAGRIWESWKRDPKATDEIFDKGTANIEFCF